MSRIISDAGILRLPKEQTTKPVFYRQRTLRQRNFDSCGRKIVGCSFVESEIIQRHNHGVRTRPRINRPTLPNGSRTNSELKGSELYRPIHPCLHIAERRSAGLNCDNDLMWGYFVKTAKIPNDAPDAGGFLNEGKVAPTDGRLIAFSGIWHPRNGYSGSLSSRSILRLSGGCAQDSRN